MGWKTSNSHDGRGFKLFIRHEEITMKKLLLKLKDLAFSPEGISTLAIIAIVTNLLSILINPITWVTAVNAVAAVVCGLVIYSIQTSDEEA